VLAQAGLPAVPGVLHRPSAIEPYLRFIGQTLKQFPSLTAARLYAMVRERGYGGRPDHFRHLIARHRPRRAAQAYLRLRTLPGEQAQVDWAHFGHLQIGRARRPLMGFVMVLSWSRQIFLRGHVAAFEAWGGAARVALYDNLKSAVLERRGDAIRLHPTLLALAGHYRYEPRPVAPARGNEKGRVERSIRHIRDAFFAGRRFADLDDLNAQAAAWCMADAGERACPEDASLRVGQAFERERDPLLSLPATPFVCEEVKAVSVGKSPYVRFDLHDDSVPATEVQRTLSVVATHARSWDRGEVIEVKQHVQDLVDSKRAARAHRDTDRLVSAAPACRDLLRQAAERGEPLGRMARALGE
jgi:transposase